MLLLTCLQIGPNQLRGASTLTARSCAGESLALHIPNQVRELLGELIVGRG